MFRRRLAAASTPAERDDLQAKLALFATDPSMQSLLAEWAGSGSAAGERIIALGAMATAARPPRRSALGLDRAAGAGNRGRQPGRRRKGVVGRPGGADRGRGIPRAGGSPVEVARDTSRTLDARLDALSALPREQAASSPDLFAVLRLSQKPPAGADRSQGAGIIERAALTREQLTEVTTWVVTAGPWNCRGCARSMPMAMRPSA